jgi:hypothetical protein
MTGDAARLETPTLELLAWIAAAPRTYTETLQVWRSSCPRLTTWEDAVYERLVQVSKGAVTVTAEGLEALARSRQ